MAMDNLGEEVFDIPLGVFVGQKFNTFEEFDQLFSKATKSARVKFYKRNSCTIDTAAKKANRQINPELKFVHLKYACVHGGKTFKSQGKGLRPKPKTTLKEKLCKAHITLKASSSGEQLEVSDVNNLHNHCVPLGDPSDNKQVLAAKCRSCLKDEESMFDLFVEYEEGNKKLADFVEDTISIKVEESDGLPRFLCRICADTIVNFHKFKTAFQDNEVYLKDLLKNFNSEVNNESSPTHSISYDNADFACDSDAFESQNFDVVKVESKETDSLDDKDDVSLAERKLQLESVLSKVKKRQKRVKNKLNTVKKIARHICKLCTQGYGQRVRIRAHLTKKHNICSDFEEHYTRILVKKEPNEKKKEPFDKLTCKACNEKFETPEEVKVHMKTHRDFICEECGSAFNKKSYLRDHMEVHEKVNKFICPYCGKAFKRRGPFGKHKKIHTHPGHAVCDACGQRFNSTSCLRTHFLLKHVRSRNYRCEVCGKSFSLKATLQKHHSRKHAGERERSFKCDICEMAYKDKSTLNRHIKVKHDKSFTKPSCHICKKEYSETVNLSRHMARHHRHANIDPEPLVDIIC